MSVHQLINKKNYIYYLSFIIPALSIFLYFAFNHFGALTVDLGQQYVDFLAFYRQKLFTNPLSLIYSFQNGLGGSMLATDAYYLMSPFNLLLFLFPIKQLPLAILTIISLKFGFAGLTSCYYWKNCRHIDSNYSLGTSIAYALSAFMVANYFNLMWLDSIILLPLLIMAIDQVFAKKKSQLILITFAIWVTNFYSGIMTLFFGLLYFLSRIFLTSKSARFKLTWLYFKKSVTASLLASFVLLPVFFELLKNKATSDVNWAFSLQFPPYQEIAKLTLGSYSFHEMEAGIPNIYCTILILFATIFYFLSKQISWQKKLANGSVLLFLIASLFVTPLVLFWHLGQFPTWYPGRFSFVLIFLCLNLSSDYLQFNERPLLWQRICIGILAIGMVSYWYFNRDNFSFLSEDSLTISTLFVILALLFYFFIFNNYRFTKEIFPTLIIIEVITNLILSLNNLSFQKNSDYQNFSFEINQATSYLNQKDRQLFRTEKAFARSDDDPFTGNYNGLTTFNSTTDQRVLKLLGNLGYLHNSNSYGNNGGTNLTDSIFGVKYYLQANDLSTKITTQIPALTYSNHRLDLDNYQVMHTSNHLIISKNHFALPIVFITSVRSNKSKTQMQVDAPVANQEHLFNAMLDKNIHLFTRTKLPSPQLIGVHQVNTQAKQYIKNKNPKYTHVNFKIPLKTNDAYYLEIPNGLTENQASLMINDKQVDLNVRDDQRHLLSIGHDQKGTYATVSFILQEDNLDLTDLKLYRLDTIKMNRALANFKEKQPDFYLNNPLKLVSSKFKTNTKRQLISTIPFDNNWLIFDNGRKIKKEIFAQTFISAKLKSGTHQLSFIYIPWLLIIGIIISLITLVCLLFELH